MTDLKTLPFRIEFQVWIYVYRKENLGLKEIPVFTTGSFTVPKI